MRKVAHVYARKPACAVLDFGLQTWIRRDSVGTSVAPQIQRQRAFVVMKKLQEDEARALLAASRFGHLGCVDDGEPYVVPINYLLDEGSIYSHSLPGRKIDAMRTHPRVCLQVDQIDDDFHWRSVIAYGKFEEMAGAKEPSLILNKLLARFPKLTPVESMIVQDAAASDSVVFRIVVDRITGVVEE